jgi:hypothetical protein
MEAARIFKFGDPTVPLIIGISGGMNLRTPQQV